MNALDKERVAALRKEGHSYAGIAELTSLPLGSVKSFCSRNELKRDTTAIPKPVDVTKASGCRQCGAAVEQLPHRKAKLFCSDACRMRWWNGQRSMRKNKKYRRVPHDDGTV